MRSSGNRAIMAGVRGAGWLLALCASFVLVGGCEQAAPVQEVVTVVGVERLCFSMSPFFGAYGDSATLRLYCSGLPDPLPSVQVGDSAVSPLLGERRGLSWELGRYYAGTQVRYVIAWRDDTLSDSVTIPHKIDSVFCNGRFIRDGALKDTVMAQERYALRWSSQQVPYFKAWVRYGLADTLKDYGKFDTLLSEKNLSIPVERDGSEIVRLSISLWPYALLRDASSDRPSPPETKRLQCTEGMLCGPEYSFTAVRADSL